MRIKTMAGVIVGLSLVAAACGSDSSDEATPATTQSSEVATTVAENPETTDAAPETTAAPQTTEVASETTAAPETTEAGMSEDDPEGGAPSAIISLSPSATEMLYALGAQDQVLAVDDYSTYPPETAEKMMGLDAFQPNVESIASLEPDLVITDGTNLDFLSQLDTLGIPHWEGMAPADLDGVYTQIEQLGATVDRIGEAAELVGQMQTDVAAALEELPTFDTPPTYYHELDDTYFSVTSDTFIGAVYEQLGLVNIADEAGADLGPYPQLSAEYIITANPDLIFLACTKYCGETAESVAARPGWDAIDAVDGAGVIGLDDDVVSRWGPRIVEFIQQISTAIAEALQPTG